MIENNERIAQMMALIHDPLFVAFELEQDAPTIFNAVGRTHTETWHSALLGWLFDPASSHGLGIYPLSQLILMLADEDGAPHTRGIDLHELLLNGDFSQARVRPNERELVEVSKPGVGRFDVFVDQIHYGAWHEIQFLIEVKVKAKIERDQCARYMAYREQQAAANTLLVPIFIAPTGQLIKPAAELFGDDRWIALDYQSIYDGIIKPSLDHPQISQFGRFTMLRYGQDSVQTGHY